MGAKETLLEETLIRGHTDNSMAVETEERSQGPCSRSENLLELLKMRGCFPSRTLQSGSEPQSEKGARGEGQNVWPSRPPLVQTHLPR